MTIEITNLSQSLADLRRQFDSAFAAPPPAPMEGRESLITLQVAGEALAVRTPHITGVAKTRRIMPVPTRVPGLLGIMALRGTLLPVYDLATLLGLPAPASAGSWLMLTNAEAPIGLVFDEFDGQVEIERACLYESENSRMSEHLRLVARVGAAHRAVVDIPGIVEDIRKTSGIPEPVKE